jgi:hypothetical protein
VRRAASLLAALLLAPHLLSAQGTAADLARADTVQRRLDGLVVEAAVTSTGLGL